LLLRFVGKLKKKLSLLKEIYLGAFSGSLLCFILQIYSKAIHLQF